MISTTHRSDGHKFLQNSFFPHPFPEIYWCPKSFFCGGFTRFLKYFEDFKEKKRDPSYIVLVQREIILRNLKRKGFEKNWEITSSKNSLGYVSFILVNIKLKGYNRSRSPSRKRKKIRIFPNCWKISILGDKRTYMIVYI